MYKQSSLIVGIINDEEKSFYKIDTKSQPYKTKLFTAFYTFQVLHSRVGSWP
jgi:hypothetical protein